MGSAESRVSSTEVKAFENYNLAVSNMRTRIGWRPGLSKAKNIERELSALRIFFVNAEKEETRNGILWLLVSISDYDMYKQFYIMHKELMLVKIEPERDHSGEGPYTFFYFIYKNPEQAVDVLRCAYSIYTYFGSKTHKVLEYLFVLGIFVTGFFFDKPSEVAYMDFFLRRADLFVRGFRDIKCSLMDRRNSPPEESWPVDWLDRGGSMAPTGGDMHCGGKIPYLIEYNGKKYVYKPRDMGTDYFITEALNLFNTGLEEQLQLPVYQIQLLDDRTGFMAFAEHIDDMDKGQAQVYFQKFGALLCFQKLFGIEDLHQENIMATASGPVIIDLECALYPHSIKKRNVISSCLKDIREYFTDKKRENATFSVNHETFSLKGWPAEYILNGFTKAAERCLVNREILRNHYSKSFSSFTYRVVPIGTESFYIEIFNMIRALKEKVEIVEIVEKVCDQIIDGLRDGWFAFAEGFEHYLDCNLLFQSVYEAMFKGEIPFFQLTSAVSGGNVSYMGFVNGNPFFKEAITLFNTDDLIQAFDSQIDWLQSDEARQSVERWINNGKIREETGQGQTEQGQTGQEEARQEETGQEEIELE